jgi:hypothetical protein
MRHPAVPESLDSWNILHRMFRFNRRAFDALSAERRAEIATEAVASLAELAASAVGDVGLAQLLGHKADMMVTHYAKTFDDIVRFDPRTRPLRSDGKDSRGSARAWPQAAFARMDRGLRCGNRRAGEVSAQRRSALGEDSAATLRVLLSDG